MSRWATAQDLSCNPRTIRNVAMPPSIEIKTSLCKWTRRLYSILLGVSRCPTMALSRTRRVGTQKSFASAVQELFELQVRAQPKSRPGWQSTQILVAMFLHRMKAPYNMPAKTRGLVLPFGSARLTASTWLMTEGRVRTRRTTQLASATPRARIWKSSAADHVCVSIQSQLPTAQLMRPARVEI